MLTTLEYIKCTLLIKPLSFLNARNLLVFKLAVVVLQITTRSFYGHIKNITAVTIICRAVYINPPSSSSPLQLCVISTVWSTAGRSESREARQRAFIKWAYKIAQLLWAQLFLGCAAESVSLQLLVPPLFLTSISVFLQIRAVRPQVLMRLSKTKKHVSRAYGGSMCAKCVRDR